MTIDSKPIDTTTELTHDVSEVENTLSFDMSDDEKTDIIAARILKKYKSAFEELAK